jgi:hypothetical protein
MPEHMNPPETEQEKTYPQHRAELSGSIYTILFLVDASSTIATLAPPCKPATERYAGKSRAIAWSRSNFLFVCLAAYFGSSSIIRLAEELSSQIC